MVAARAALGAGEAFSLVRGLLTSLGLGRYYIFFKKYILHEKLKNNEMHKFKIFKITPLIRGKLKISTEKWVVIKTT